MLCVRTTQRSPRALPSPSVSRRWISSCGTVRRRRSTWPVSSSGPSSFGSTPPPGIVARSQATWRRSSGSAIASQPASARTLERRSTRDSATFASPRTRGTCPPPPTMRPGWAPACDTSSRGSQSGDREARLRLRGGPPKIERVSAGARGTMLDYLVRGGTVVDGTGAPGRRADVGVRDGRIVAVADPGSIDELATETVEADGLVVAPGFVDPHTHYDAQLFWDPAASPSNVHGVTSLVAGNCGFTLAPLHQRDADYLRRMMAKVEGMSLDALERGVDWQWESFAEYLDRLDGGIGVNAGFMVGHCALRRYVMGEDAVGGEASPAQIDAMVALLHEAIEAGGLGFSTTLSSTHSDGDGQPVASRHASTDELLALCRAVGEHDGTVLEGAFEGGLDKFSDDEIELVAAMTAASGGRSINWNVLTVDSREPERVPRQLTAA